ncbi:CYTH domain-containing protein [Erysipelothrix sp. HDW6C]|uniref:CYTH domain-containing protein n=1 Tax=Erysipelothrix sp. HDW6C TaxID=2714930 RepID=UPI00140E69F1|nr:CYTH domain-containing protein [Erysipelothrix sp. HDW6C]QIK69093.1 CYTH domain-containing protein [Erysipelothrix sp. HDW6C]
MKQHLEIEYKSMLTKADYDLLARSLPFGNAHVQLNEYYDTSDRQLFARESMCRIRTIGNRHEFTMKTPQPDGVLEHELELKAQNLNDERLVEYFDDLGINVYELERVAFSRTLRKTYDDAYGTWCLDSTSFSNHQDYEIEYELFEANEKARPHYVNTLNQLGIEFKPSAPKYIRALNSLD